jgi:hypothetical protein
MLRRHLFELLLVSAVLATTQAMAAPGDAGAERKINEAINQHYFATNFDQAETVLMSAVQGCGTQCNPRVLARIWMYAGLVRINGKEDRAGAVQAFKRALALDPGVTLDDSLVTPGATAAFAEAGGKQGGAAPAATGAAAATTAAAPGTQAPAGPIHCVPEPRDIGVGQPIPITCTTSKPAASGTIFYMVPDGTEWVAELLRQQGGALQGTIPCAGVAREGTLHVYVELRDQQAKVIENLGTKAAPLDFSVVKSSGLPAPSFPGQPPPPKCKKSDLKKATRGTKEWGDSCGSDNECKTGLCVSGSCDNCKVDKDCASNSCNSGNCAIVETPEGAEEGEPGAPSGKAVKNWAGLSVGADIGVAAGSDICSRDSQNSSGYACFYQNQYGAGTSTQYLYDPYPGLGGKLNAGLAGIPILLTYDRVLGTRITVGGRVGYVVGGNKMPKPTAGNGVSFIPVHVEGRLGVWFGSDPFGDSSIRPHLNLALGLGTGNIKGTVQIADCRGGIQSNGTVPPAPPTYNRCATGSAAPNQAGYKPANMDAFKTMGPIFAAGGGGVMFAFSPTFGIDVNVNAVVYLPTFGIAIEPMIGPAIGF